MAFDILYFMLPRAAAFLLAAVLLLIANRGAWEGYFSDDDLDNIAWTRGAGPAYFAQGLASPRYYPQNFRPTGHFYFHILGRTAGLDFRWYLAVLQMLHLLNVCLVWRLCSSMELPAAATGAGALFFAFHMGVFDALWKPMYVFDVLCATFCLLALLCWRGSRPILSLLCFWMAYKSKELAVMLPLVLAAHELFVREKRGKWEPLVPFFLVSAMFGAQALLSNPGAGADYSLRLSPAALAQTVSFYSSKILLAPYLGLGLLALPWVVADRRLRFGLALSAALLAPMLLLPGRLSGAYLYASLPGLALTAAVISSRAGFARTALFFSFWLPANYLSLREQRKAELTVAHENRAYVEAVGDAVRTSPGTRTIIYDGAPAAMRSWGIAGALRYFTGGEVELYSVEDKNLREALEKPAVMLLGWDGSSRKLHTAARAAGAPDGSYLSMSRGTRIWQLEEGWYPLEGTFRWTRPRARARLHRPPDARRFDLSVNVGHALIHDLGRTRVELLIDGVPLGAREFTAPGWRQVHWDLPPAPAGSAAIEFHVTPEYRPATDPRILGIAIGGFGFAAKDSP